MQTMPQKLWKLEEVKNYLRISHHYDDELIENLTYAAIIGAENFINQNIIIRKIEFACNIKQETSFKLKHKPIIEILQVILKDREEERILSADECSLTQDNILHISYPLENHQELIVRYLSGMLPEIIEYGIKYGILLHISELYDREHLFQGQLSNDIKGLYLPYRNFQV
jgi:hypothetical protein